MIVKDKKTYMPVKSYFSLDAERYTELKRLKAQEEQMNRTQEFYNKLSKVPVENLFRSSNYDIIKSCLKPELRNLNLGHDEILRIQGIEERVEKLLQEVEYIHNHRNLDLFNNDNSVNSIAFDEYLFNINYKRIEDKKEMKLIQQTEEAISHLMKVIPYNEKSKRELLKAFEICNKDGEITFNEWKRSYNKNLK